MTIDVGKYRGRELSELPTDYLEWAITHLSLTDNMRRGVQAEYSHRVSAARVAAETPAERILEKIARPVNRVIARLQERLRAWLRGLGRDRQTKAR